MDEFAQSREDDDLFADEFEPVSVPVVVEAQESVSDRPEESRVEAPKPDNAPQQSNHAGSGSHRGRGQQQGRGRGRGRGRGASASGDEHRGLNSSRWADKEAAPVPAAAPPKTTPPQPSEPQSTEPNTSSTEPAAQPPVQPQAQPQPQPQPQSQSQPPTEQRVHAVRGDRSGTGGTAHKKLTEEELSAKMAAMAILNAKKAERHRLSEADSAAFQQREKEQQKKRVEEQKSRREMDMERAKNRERKLKAQGGREWDEGKTEADIVDRTTGRSSQYVRGGHGGVIRGGGGLSSSRYGDGDGEKGEEAPAPAARGRGGLNIRGRGGRGGSTAAPKIPTAEDFPSLPASAKTVASPTVEKPAGDWAEEMAVEEKPTAAAS